MRMTNRLEDENMLTYRLNPATLNFNTLLTDSLDEKWHSHDFFEIFYITEGTIQHLTSTLNEKLEVGDAYLLTPDVAHTFQRLGVSCQHRDIIIRPAFFEHCCAFVDETLYEDLKQQRLIKFRLTENEMLVFEQQIYNFLSKDFADQHKKNYEKVLTVSLLGILYNHNHLTQTFTDFKQKALLVINRYYVSQNALQLIRQAFNYNDIYFARKIKECFHCTLSQYILQMRLNHAAFLLTTSPLSVSEITHSIGLQSENYFIKVFKEKFGTTPAKYRKDNTTQIKTKNER